MNILTDVSHVEVMSMELLLSVSIAVGEGLVVGSDVLQQFLIRVVLDTTIVV